MVIIRDDYLDAKSKENSFPLIRTNLIYDDIDDREWSLFGGMRELSRNKKLTQRQKLLMSIFSRIERAYQFLSYSPEDLEEIIGEPAEKIEKDIERLIQLKLITLHSFEEMEVAVYGKVMG